MTRKYQRASLEIDIDIELDGRTRSKASCRDVSIGGAFIVCPSQMETAPASGSGLTVYLPLPGFADPVAVRGAVRWSTLEGMGVQFEAIDEEETKAFVELLKAR